MPSLPKRSKKSIPPKLPLRAALLVRFIRWRGPVGSVKTGATVVRHRRGLRTSARVGQIAIRVAGAAIVVGAVAGAVNHQRQKDGVPAAV